jgi:hypothetical protein
MRLASYMRMEKTILASDGDTITERWKWGRRVLNDDTAVTPRGYLQHGVLDRYLAKAKSQGIRLSEREIQRRLKAARTYRTEAEIRHAVSDFNTWHDLVAAAFPEVTLDDPGEPYDPRHHDEKLRDNGRKLRRAELERWQQSFPGMDEYTTLQDMVKLLAERQGLTSRRVREEAVLAGELQSLIDAVDGDLSATVEEALDALDAQNGLTDDTEADDTDN